MRAMVAFSTRTQWKFLLGSMVGIHVVLAAAAGNNNPYEQGCLYAYNLTNDIRVCGSQDLLLPDAIQRGICRQAPFDYKEVRINAGNWESSIFGAWILQIVLSELLHVPTSLTTGPDSQQNNLYHPDNILNMSVSHSGQDIDILRTTHDVGGDCQKALNLGKECAHFETEDWSGRTQSIIDLVYDGIIEPPQDLGMIATDGWYVPKKTAERDPSLLNYRGMQGNTKRNDLAKHFKRPTSWIQYCQEISDTNCSIPDQYAQRAPVSHKEESKFFMDGIYTGYFRGDTDQANCTKYPTNCTGFFQDFPCDWRSPVVGQLYWLDIGLSTDFDMDGNGGLPVSHYSQLVEVWRAANATKSDVIMYWWAPEIIMGEFQGTDYEFVPIVLPAPTQECLDAKAFGPVQCSLNFTERVGNPKAVCGEPAKGLHSLMSTTLYTQSYGTDKNPIPLAIQSPAHAALSNYRLSELQMNEMFSLLIQFGGGSNNSYRQAICTWAVDNMDYLKTLIPRSFPRKAMAKKETKSSPWMFAATLVGSLVVILVIVTSYMVYRFRKKKTIMYSQIEFLALLLSGAFMIAIGAVIMGAPSSSDASCVIEIWAINIGYSVELIPLIVKVAAVNHVVTVGRKMNRVRIQRKFLFGVVTAICALVVAYLITWTVLDPPRVIPEYQLTDSVNADGETIVWVLNVCKSQSPIFSYSSVGWNALLLLATTVEAIKMRKISRVGLMEGFNETSTLALLVYSHMFFVLLRVISYLLSSYISEYVLSKCRSLIFSIDTTATMAIYFFPKFFATEDRESMYISGHDFTNTERSVGSTISRLRSSLTGLRQSARQSTRRNVANNPVTASSNNNKKNDQTFEAMVDDPEQLQSTADDVSNSCVTENPPQQESAGREKPPKRHRGRRVSWIVVEHDSESISNLPDGQEMKCVSGREKENVVIAELKQQIEDLQQEKIALEEAKLREKQEQDEETASLLESNKQLQKEITELRQQQYQQIQPESS